MHDDSLDSVDSVNFVVFCVSISRINRLQRGDKLTGQLFERLVNDSIANHWRRLISFSCWTLLDDDSQMATLAKSTVPMGV